MVALPFRPVPFELPRGIAGVPPIPVGTVEAAATLSLPRARALAADITLRPPEASRPPAVNTPEPRSAAPAPMVATVEITSFPVNAGDPPRTPEMSFGACQHRAAKMTDAPIIEKASVAGWPATLIRSASSSQLSDTFIPVLIRR